MLEAGYRFRVIPPDPRAECGVCSGESPLRMVARLAYQKAADVAAKVRNAVVIGCDTIVECSGAVLGKPEDRTHAQAMLWALRGREHRVLSGLCLLPVPEGEPRVATAVTRLVMDHLSDAEIERYLDSGQWEGKAGAFGYQDRLGWVHVVEGSESNVVGLPLELLESMLEQVAPELLPSR